jgi:hypothetical protein
MYRIGTEKFVRLPIPPGKNRLERFLTSRSDGPKGGCQGWWPQKIAWSDF